MLRALFLSVAFAQNNYPCQEMSEKAVLCHRPYMYLFIQMAKIRGVLASRISYDKTIQGIKLLKKEIKLSQFAFDTSPICKTLTSVGNVLIVLVGFGASQVFI